MSSSRRIVPIELADYLQPIMKDEVRTPFPDFPANPHHRLNETPSECIQAQEGSRECRLEKSRGGGSLYVAGGSPHPGWVKAFCAACWAEEHLCPCRSLTYTYERELQ